jgi:hypothetical protein
MIELKLGKELVEYCKNQLKKGCGKCEMRPTCCVSHPITKHHNEQYVKNNNERFKNIKKL